MNEENQVSYYAIIPATVRYDKRLKPAEKILYGEITSLTNKMGYCYANNRYFSQLYGVTIHTISSWVSNLEKQGYIQTEVIRNKGKEIKERRIYIRDNPYVQKNTYPYVLKSTYPMYKKVQDNNKRLNIDDLFLFIINRDSKISEEFYSILEKLEFNYTNEMIESFTEENIEILKGIIFVLYDLYINNFKTILNSVNRESLINLYKLAKAYMPNDILNYYKKTILNKYSKT